VLWRAFAPAWTRRLRRQRWSPPPDRGCLPGLTEGSFSASRDRLLALPKGHKYRAVASRSFRPRYAPNDEQWERAVPLLVEILAHDPRQLAANDRSLQIHRSALASHLYWLAGDYPDQLTADFALDERQVSQSAARSEGYLTRRSRHAYMSKLRYFRRGYPKLFPAKDPIPPANHFGPVTDVEFDIALQAAETFRSRGTRDRVRALLLLSRAAGADAADCRHVTGADLFRRADAGLWVRLGPPGHSREVPVLQRFAPQLEELARRAGRCSLLSGEPPPAPTVLTGSLAILLKRKLESRYPNLSVTTGGIRKAWLLEQLSTWEALQVVLQAAGLQSLKSFDHLLPRCPSPTTDSVRLAELLGGISARGLR